MNIYIMATILLLQHLPIMQQVIIIAFGLGKQQ